MKLTLEGQEAMLYFLDPGESICGNYLEFLFGILTQGRYVYSPHLFIYPIIYLQYGFMEVYLMLWSIIQYYFIYFLLRLLQLWML